MPALTSPRQYPYPLDGDPINVAGDIQKLAVKIDDDVTAIVAKATTDSTTNLAKKYDKTGGTITGNSHITGTLTVDGPSTINDATLINADTNEGLTLANANATPRLLFHQNSPVATLGTIVYSTAALHVQSNAGDLWLWAHNIAKLGIVGTTTPAVLIGKTDADLDAAGVSIGAGGAVLGSVRSTTGVASSQNFYARHIGAADAAGQQFAAFVHGTGSGTAVLGSITQTAAGVAYNVTSDYRIKNDLGPVTGALDKIMALKPKHLSLKSNGEEFDGFIAHEVAEVLPNAVSGEKDALLPDDHDTDPGGMDLQQLDTAAMIPLIVAALQEIAARLPRTKVK